MAEVAVATPINTIVEEESLKQGIVRKDSQGNIAVPTIEEPVVIDAKPEQDGAENELADTVRAQSERIKDLEMTVSDTRKMVRSLENMLASLQWKPKEDFYAWKNPTINDKTVRDAQERKLKTLVEQMRLMEKLLAERDQVINAMMAGGLENVSPASSTNTSPFSSPMSARSSDSNGSGRSPGWSRSPAESPNVDKKASWWFFKRSSSAINKSTNSMNSSTSSISSSTGNFASPISSPNNPHQAKPAASPSV